MSKKKSDSADDHTRFETTPENKKKAQQWFRRGKELGEKRQFDYAIEYYVNGLEFWPDAVEEALMFLHGCAVARRDGGGGKPGLKDTMKRSMNDKDAMKAYLNALWLFGHDPTNIGFSEGVVKTASRLRAEDAAMYAGGVLHFQALEGSAKAGPKQFNILATLMEELGDRASERGEMGVALEAWQKGMDALSLWRSRNTKDQTVDKRLRDLSTKHTISKGKYQDGESFTESISDKEEQKERHDLDRSMQSEERVDELIAGAEREFKENPDKPEPLNRLLDLLCRREQPDEENKAIRTCMEVFEKTDAYRWKQRGDDIRMKQLGREARKASKSGDADAIKAAKIKQLKFELTVFKERISRYPTDLRIKFEYGVRLFRAGRIDDAIPALQSARNDPKNRAACGLYLGRSFIKKGFYSQAIPTLEEALEAYEYPDDNMGKDLHYWLGRAQEDSKAIEDARKTYGKILQMDYNYRDVRVRLEGLAETD